MISSCTTGRDGRNFPQVISCVFPMVCNGSYTFIGGVFRDIHRTDFASVQVRVDTVVGYNDSNMYY